MAITLTVANAEERETVKNRYILHMRDSKSYVVKDRMLDNIGERYRHFDEETFISKVKEYHAAKRVYDECYTELSNHRKDTNSILLGDDKSERTYLLFGDPEVQSSWVVMIGNESADGCFFYVNKKEEGRKRV